MQKRLPMFFFFLILPIIKISKGNFMSMVQSCFQKKVDWKKAIVSIKKWTFVTCNQCKDPITRKRETLESNT